MTGIVMRKYKVDSGLHFTSDFEPISCCGWGSVRYWYREIPERGFPKVNVRGLIEPKENSILAYGELLSW